MIRERGTGSQGLESPAQNLGKEFGEFLKNRDPVLAKKLGEMFPDLVSAAFDFMEGKSPAQAEAFFLGALAGARGVDKDQIEYDGMAGLKSEITKE